MWNLLIKQYNNKRRLIHEHIHALHTLLRVQQFVNKLAALFDKATMTIQAIKNLGCSVHHWNDLFVYFIVQQFDQSTREAWEIKIGNTREYPAYMKLDSFLATRIRAYFCCLVISNIEIEQIIRESHTAIAVATVCPACKQK